MSAVPFEQKMCSMPNQSATRAMVPTLPGSCTSSSARHKERAAISSFVSYCGCSNIANTSCGLFCRLARASSSALTVRISAAWACGFRARHSSVQTSSLHVKCSDRSPTSLGPSAMKACSSFRFYFSSNERMYFILALLSIYFL